MGKYDTENVVLFDRAVIEDKMLDQLITKLDLNQFIENDYDLVENAGMKKQIITYHGTGDVEDLAMGEGNSDIIGVYPTTAEYEVKTTQGKGEYFDEQVMADPRAIDKLVNHITTQLTNDITKKVINEYKKADKVIYDFDFSYPEIVRARAAFPGENQDGLFMLVNTEDGAELQITLEASLKYSEGYIRSGYIGSIAGMPIYTTDAMPKGMAVIATKEAITNFVKKGVQVEMERDIDTRKNTVVGRNVKVIALTDATKVIRLSTADDPRTGYTKLTAKPDTWATTYDDYYVYNKVADKMEANDEDDWDKVKANIWSKDV